MSGIGRGLLETKSAALLLLAAWGWPIAAGAATPAAEAMSGFQEGMVHFRAGRCPEALSRFEAAQKLRPGGGLLRKIASCREKAGELRAARAALVEYLADPGRPDRAAVTRDLERVDQALARLPPPRAPAIDHAPVTETPRGLPVTLSARAVSAGGRAVKMTLHLQIAGIPGFSPAPMQPDPADAQRFQISLPPSVTREDFDYYLEAEDDSGAPASRKGSPEKPFRVTVQSTAPQPRRGRPRRRR